MATMSATSAAFAAYAPYDTINEHQPNSIIHTVCRCQKKLFNTARRLRKRRKRRKAANGSSSVNDLSSVTSTNSFSISSEPPCSSLNDLMKRPSTDTIATATTTSRRSSNNNVPLDESFSSSSSWDHQHKTKNHNNNSNKANRLQGMTGLSSLPITSSRRRIMRMTNIEEEHQRPAPVMSDVSPPSSPVSTIPKGNGLTRQHAIAAPPPVSPPLAISLSASGRSCRSTTTNASHHHNTTSPFGLHYRTVDHAEFLFRNKLETGTTTNVRTTMIFLHVFQHEENNNDDDDDDYTSAVDAIMDTLSKQMRHFQFYRMHARTAPQVVEQYQIQSFPTVLCLQPGTTDKNNNNNNNNSTLLLVDQMSDFGEHNLPGNLRSWASLNASSSANV